MLQSDINAYHRAKRFSIDFVENMQNYGYRSVLIWVPLFWFFPDSLHWSFVVIHLLLAHIHDQWWGKVFRAHQLLSLDSHYEFYELYLESEKDGDKDRYNELRYKSADVGLKVWKELERLREKQRPILPAPPPPRSW